MSRDEEPLRELLDFDSYADGIADASIVLRDNAARSGLDAPVGTCPGWTVRDLVLHTGVIHRWATGCLLGDRLEKQALAREGAGHADLLDWLEEGVQGLLRTLDRSPEDLAAWFFLADAPAPRLAWARRQCHETTVHAVDAMATSLGHVPPAGQVWFGSPLAADGIDELLTGFLPRRTTTFRPRSGTGTVGVLPEDVGRGWTVQFSPDAAPVARRTPAGTADVATSLRGSAVDLYLTLWNRAGPGQSVAERGEPFLADWAEGMKVI